MWKLIAAIISIILLILSIIKSDDNFTVEKVDGWDADSYESY